MTSGIAARQRHGIRGLDTVFEWGTLAIALLFPLVLVAMIGMLAQRSATALTQFGFGFLFSEAWDPVKLEFGALTSIVGTLLTTVVAMTLAVPMSLGIAFFLVEYCPPGLRRVLSSAIELLAAIPSIVFGMWGLFVLIPLLGSGLFPLIGNLLGISGGSGISVLAAGMILAIMILPFMAMMMQEILLMTPAVLRESAIGAGATKWEMAWQVTFRFAWKELVGVSFLGLGRALGETMAVTFVIGNSHNASFSLLKPGNTIASTLANEFAEAVEPLHQSSLVTLGLILFAISLTTQLSVQAWLHRQARRIAAR